MKSRLPYFIPPVVLWFFLYKSFFLGQDLISGENFYQYSTVKFYLDNLRMGTFPLWNPFMMWGTPFLIELINVGPFNPVWGLTLILNIVGFSVYQAYFYTIVLYFFIGFIGFYYLAESIFHKKWCAYAAFVMLMFSSLSIPLMGQFIMILLFVPVVWFFYFFILFCRRWERRSFLAMVYCLMLIFSTYLPFYFLMVFVTVLLGWLFFDPGVCVETIQGAGRFVRRHLSVFLSGILLLVLALTPTVDLFRSILYKEIVVPFRQQTEDVLNSGAFLDHYEKATSGDISAKMSVEDIYSNLDRLEYGNDGFFYVSLFAYIVLLLGAVNPLNRRVIFLFWTTLTLFLLGIGNASWLHPFLYKYVSLFKLFRNLHYLMPFLLAAFVLLTVEQLRGFVEWIKGSGRHRFIGILWVLAVHISAGIFLLSQEGIIASSYVMLLVSFLFFVILPSEKFRGTMWEVLLCLVIVLQPAEVLFLHNRQAVKQQSEIFERTVKVSPAVAQFSFKRPPLTERLERGGASQRMIFEGYRIAMTDTPADFTPDAFTFPTMSSYYLRQYVSASDILWYLGNKFWIYDEVEELKYPHAADVVKNGLLHKLPRAYVAPEDHAMPAKRDLGRLPEFFAVEKDSEQFRVVDFGVNSLEIETNFLESKFLVYNDSFLPGWQAFRNGNKIPVYWANLAFKGIQLSPGFNRVSLQYRPRAEVFYFALLLVFWGTFGAVAVSFFPRSKLRQTAAETHKSDFMDV